MRTVAPQGNQQARFSEDVFQARLSRVNATTIRLDRYNGRWIYVAGRFVDPGSAGLSRLSTDNLISAAGADALAAPAVNTLYRCYVSNGLVSFSPSSIRLSATAPTSVSGVLYLGAAGEAANWRYVGDVYAYDAGAGVVEWRASAVDWGVRNEHNAQTVSLVTCPGYQDDNAFTSWTYNAATWAQANGGTGSRITFLADGSKPSKLFAQANLLGAGGGIGLGVDSTTGAIAASYMTAATYGSPGALDRSQVLSAGYHKVDLLVVSTAAPAVVTFYADFPRWGGAADPQATYLKVEVQA